MTSMASTATVSPELADSSPVIRPRTIVDAGSVTLAYMRLKSRCIAHESIQSTFPDAAFIIMWERQLIANVIDIAGNPIADNPCVESLVSLPSAQRRPPASQSFGVWLLQLERSHFDGLSRQWSPANVVRNNSLNANAPTMSPQIVSHIRGRLAQLVRHARSAHETTQELDGVLTHELPTILLHQAWGMSHGPTKRRARDVGFSRAMRFINRFQQEPIELADIATAAHICNRTLNTAFHEYVGMSPMAYLKRHRLHAAHRRLGNGTQDLTITRVANDCGFWHLGQFARDYQNLLGELPSKTLQSAPHRHQQQPRLVARLQSNRVRWRA